MRSRIRGNGRSGIRTRARARARTACWSPLPSPRHVCGRLFGVFPAVCGSPTYLPTYLLTNLPAPQPTDSVSPPNRRYLRVRVRRGGTVCVFMCATFVRGIARLTHRHTAYSPPYGPLRSPLRLTNLLRERSRFSLIFRLVRGTKERKRERGRVRGRGGRYHTPRERTWTTEHGHQTIAGRW